MPISLQMRGIGTVFVVSATSLWRIMTRAAETGGIENQADWLEGKSIPQEWISCPFALSFGGFRLQGVRGPHAQVHDWPFDYFGISY